MTAVLSTADDALLPFTVVPHARWLTGRYELLEELGRGGMSVVYLARERASGRLVAVKVIGRGEDDVEAAARVAREVRVAAALRHPHIVETLAIEEGEGAAALVTTYVAGGTLRAALRTAVDAGVPWPYARVAGVLRDVAAALAHAHACRIVHRDVKPENIFLDDRAVVDGGGRALLADFGIARPLEHDVLRTVAGAAAGTPSYMAPEQVAGLAVDERTDVYALGLVGWEMLAGRRPWQGETLYALLHKQQYEALPPLAPLRPDIPAYLLAAVEGALAKAPERRWRDGAEFLRQLTPTPAQLPPLVVPDAAVEDVSGATVRFAVDSAGAVPPAGGRTGRTARAGRRVGVVAGGVVVAALAALFMWPPARDQSGRSGVTRARAADTHVSITGVAHGDVDRAASRPEPSRPEPSRPVPTPTLSPPPVRATDRVGPDSARPGGRVAAVPASDARTAEVRCASPSAADRRACRLAVVAPADARLTTAYTALLAAMQQSVEAGWESRAVRTLRVEQRRWQDARERECRRRQTVADLARGEGGLAECLAATTERRAAELAARRARFAVEAPDADDGAEPPRRR